MAIEMRAARADELAKVHDLVAMSFNADRTEKGRQGMIHIESLANPTVLLADGEIVAALRVYDFVHRINGAEVSLGGVSSVSCYPEHRRKGHVGRLLVDALATMREKGQPLSALYTPHPSLYRKYGYITAGTNVKYTWAPKALRPYAAARPDGSATRVGEDDWRVLEGVYERYWAPRTGAMKRTEAWWREGVFRRIYDPERKMRDVAVWQGGSGPEGYLAYSHISAEFGGVVNVAEFVALTGDAYTGLLRYVLSHDLDNEIVWYGAIDDPLPLTVEDPSGLKREVTDDYMLRVVDIEAAVGARPAGRGARDGAVSLRIDDATAPWNTGTWRIENAGGTLSTKKMDGEAQVTMEAATFAALYNGYLRASEAVRCGLAVGTDAAALSLADELFASEYVPNCSDFF